MAMSHNINQIQQNLKDEVEQKQVFQKEAKESTQLMKILEEENLAIQNQLDEVSLQAQQLAMKNEEYKGRIKKREAEIEN